MASPTTGGTGDRYGLGLCYFRIGLRVESSDSNHHWVHGDPGDDSPRLPLVVGARLDRSRRHARHSHPAEYCHDHLWRDHRYLDRAPVHGRNRPRHNAGGAVVGNDRAYRTPQSVMGTTCHRRIDNCREMASVGSSPAGHRPGRVGDRIHLFGRRNANRGRRGRCGRCTFDCAGHAPSDDRHTDQKPAEDHPHHGYVPATVDRRLVQLISPGATRASRRPCQIF